MKHGGPIEPAQVVFGAAGEPPRSARHDDLYHPRIGAFEQARHVFLQGNGLPQRWRGRAGFTVLELGFGLGNNFIATWLAWRADPARCERLQFVAIEKHPLVLADLRRAQAESEALELAAELIAAWPPLTPGLHLLRFDEGHVELLLALGDVRALLPRLRLAADAVYLDGFAPVREPELNAAMWSPEVMKAVARRAAADATAATWSTAPALHAALRVAGFEVGTAPGIGGKRRITVARFAPRPSFAKGSAATGPARTALVVGGGIAGAAAAAALARRGLVVTLLEAGADVAGAASSLPAGLFHGTVHAEDGPYARLFRAAALFAARCYAVGAAGSPGGPIGLLRKADGDAGPSTTAWPEGFVRRLDATEASRLSGAVIDSDAWFYPGGGWIGGAEAVRRLLEPSGVTVLTGVQVAALSRSKPQNAWRAEDAAGHTLAEADIAVLANGAAAPPLLAALGHPPWPLHTRRGQLTHWLPQRAQGLQLPVAGDGYVVPMPGGTLLCGATRQEADDDPQVRHADHADNLRRLRRLTGIGPSTGDALQGWVGFRLHSDDRLPIAGAMPLAVLPATQRLDQARWLPREPGLFVLCALGARGLTLAPLLGELVAAQATGTPWPLEQDLADAVDPGRWRVRAARRGSSAGA